MLTANEDITGPTGSSQRDPAFRATEADEKSAATTLEEDDDIEEDYDGFPETESDESDEDRDRATTVDNIVAKLSRLQAQLAEEDGDDHETDARRTAREDRRPRNTKRTEAWTGERVENRVSSVAAVSTRKTRKDAIRSVEIKECINAINQERSKAHVIAQELGTLLSRPTIRDDMRLLSSSDEHRDPALKQSLTDEHVMLRDQLQGMRSDVIRLCRQLRNPHPGQAYISAVKTLLESVESKVMAMRNKSQER
ncbi:hypothetical protein HKX48_001746, partial [Thoreauomyces humboldtii]